MDIGRMKLTAARFRRNNYEKLQTENAWSEDTEGCLKAKEEKFRKIARLNRKNPKR